MAIPDSQSTMLPVLKYLSDKKERRLREVFDGVAEYFKLSDEEKNKPLPSGNDLIFENRVRWAKFHLTKAGLVGSPGRGLLIITEQGLKAVEDNPSNINYKYLQKFPDYKKFKEANVKGETPPSPPLSTGETPEESMEYGYQKIKEGLVEEILKKVKNCSPNFFERLVLRLLVKMGYGGSIKDAGQAIGKSGDEGIDGVIKEDRLGLDVIYLQAKRWEGTVGRPEIQKFSGALQGKRAKKGVFITTSGFSSEAKNYVSNIDNKIILIDGEQLAALMIDYDIGVSTVASYEIKKLDTDYFEDE